MTLTAPATTLEPQSLLDEALPHDIEQSVKHDHKRTPPNAFMKNPTRTQKAMEYVQTNWHKGETLKEIAERFKLDKGNLDRAFRNDVGEPIKKYMDKQKKELVKTLIDNDSLSGYAIARTLNMREQTFYRWFKRMFGKTLTEARGK